MAQFQTGFKPHPERRTTSVSNVASVARSESVSLHVILKVRPALASGLTAIPPANLRRIALPSSVLGIYEFHQCGESNFPYCKFYVCFVQIFGEPFFPNPVVSEKSLQMTTGYATRLRGYENNWLSRPSMFLSQIHSAASTVWDTFLIHHNSSRGYSGRCGKNREPMGICCP